jgi:hypothetical protein
LEKIKTHRKLKAFSNLSVHTSDDAYDAGVDVVITIFCDFSQFLGEIIGVFLEYQCYDNFFSKLSFVKNAIFFTKFIGENIFFNHSIGPIPQSHF